MPIQAPHFPDLLFDAAERLRRWENATLVVGASAGLALLGALDSPAEMLARADAAMYARKHEKKGVTQ